jgi:transporter family-2 protein
MLLDHFGWLGFEQKPVSMVRVIGGLLLLGGVALVLWEPRRG